MIDVLTHRCLAQAATRALCNPDDYDFVCCMRRGEVGVLVSCPLSVPTAHPSTIGTTRSCTIPMHTHTQFTCIRVFCFASCASFRLIELTNKHECTSMWGCCCASCQSMFMERECEIRVGRVVQRHVIETV